MRKHTIELLNMSDEDILKNAGAEELLSFDYTRANQFLTIVPGRELTRCDGRLRPIEDQVIRSFFEK